MFGEWLRQQRELRRLTREEFSKRVGCSVSALRKIEGGERRPSEQIADLMANCLNIPAAEHPTFVKVARGELGVDHLQPAKLAGAANIPSLKNNLPILPTPLIGRQREVEELLQLLNDPQCRLVTLVGPGGIGKTRLAIETALQIQDIFADGVYFVALASVTSTRFIVPVIADALGFTFESANRANPKTQLFAYLKEKKILLLTDNLEQLLNESGIETLAELLAKAPQIKLLATSRESLGLQGEWLYEVQGLPIPASDDTEENARNTSVELFLQRARRAHVGFSAKAGDYPAIVRICHLVDGTPLAIELAAAWTRTLSCDEIAREIERGLDFLSANTRDLPARHRSMRAVFEHSWKLLADEERQVLPRLAVFRGGFQREAAEQIAGASLPALSSLVTKSLVRRSGENRYDLHEIVRQYALELLTTQADVQQETRERHARYYAEYFSARDESLRNSMQRKALIELTAEMDNFRAAWDWAISHEQFALIDQVMRAFQSVYDLRGWLQEGIDLASQAIHALEKSDDLTTDETKQAALGHLLISRSLFLFRLARHEESKAMLERSLEILRPLKRLKELAEANTYLGVVLVLMGDYARAVAALDEGLEIAVSIGDRWYANLCRNQRASVVLRTFKPAEAYEQLKGVVAEWRAIGDPRFIAYGNNIFSQAAMALGKFDEARIALEESAELVVMVGDKWGMGAIYRGLGVIAQIQGDHTKALELFRKSLNTLSELGSRQDAAQTLVEMGRSFFALNREAEAVDAWTEALRIATETGGTFIALLALIGFASQRAKQGRLEDAHELLLHVLNHPANIQETKNRAEKLRAELEAQLTPQQVGDIQARVKSRTFEAVTQDMINA